MLKPIITDRDYAEALAQVDKLWDTVSDADTLDALAALIEEYEDKHFKF